MGNTFLRASQNNDSLRHAFCLQELPFPLFAAIFGANGVLMVLCGGGLETSNIGILDSEAIHTQYDDERLKVCEAAFGQPALMSLALAMSTAAAVCLRFTAE